MGPTGVILFCYCCLADHLFAVASDQSDAQQQSAAKHSKGARLGGSAGRIPNQKLLLAAILSGKNLETSEVYVHEICLCLVYKILRGGTDPVIRVRNIPSCRLNDDSFTETSAHRKK